MNGYLIGSVIGTCLAIFDLVFLGLIKEVYLGNFNKNWIWLACIGYGFVPFLFYKGLQYTSLTILNLSWDIMSDIIVTSAGILFFKEYIGTTKAIGIAFAIIALMIMSIEDFINVTKN